MAYKKVMAAAFAVTLFLAGCAGSTDKGTSPAAVPLKETMNPTSILHHSRKPIITLSWKREKMLLLLQAILRTGRKCISPL